MKIRNKNYFIGGVVLVLAGLFLIYKNSWGKYIDPWLSAHSKYKGHSSYWLVVAGIGMVLAGILLASTGFTKANNQPASATK
jgi:hypothetical protein